MAILATLKPNRIVKRFVADARPIQQTYFEKLAQQSEPRSQNLKIKKSSFGLSYQTTSKIKDSVQLLAVLAPKRNVKIGANKYIYGFKTNFITLTLPSPQVHTDQEIKGCLNNFLTRCRQVFGLKNYVWKAELQRNKNIHFHIITDTYMHHKQVRYYWNKAINTLGYVDRYQQKMQHLTLSEYAKLRKKPVHEVTAAFAKGCRSNWRNPATEQVVKLASEKDAAIYLAKYLAKPTATASNTKEEGSKKNHITIAELVRIRRFGRVWARSQSLSKIKLVTRWAWDDIEALISQCKDWQDHFFKVVHDYCEVYYFRLNKLPGILQKAIRRLLVDIGKSYNYPVPT